MSDVFSSCLARTPEEATIIVSISYLSFIQNLPNGEKMELVYEITHSMFKASSLFSVVSTDRGDEKVKAANSLLEEKKIHDSPYTLDAKISKLEGPLIVTEKLYQNSFDVVNEKTH
ncbi:unnamed protein product [Vicia faba]|uniref:Uncharacterized protein n=1 Tax=Vicia faba TaxID=3906 RepID=A0AAV0YPC9_VICFA|nr:unnamed protein product [Vicia faba]